MRRQLRLNSLHPLLGMGLLLFVGKVAAGTLYFYPQWTYTSEAATTCSFSYPELLPLSQPRTLIVDNHLPNGSVLYSWGYANFAPNFSGGCSYLSTKASGAANQMFRLFFDGANASSYFPTNNSGIQIRFYYTYHTKGSRPAGSMAETTHLDGLSTEPALGVEYPAKAVYGTPYLGPVFNPVRPNTPPYNSYFDWSASHYSMSLRAELVKVGDISYTATPLTIPTSDIRLLASISGNSPSPASSTAVKFKAITLGGGGINIIAPSCRLTSPSDYEIDLGRWVHAGPGTHQPGVSLPAYGSIKPINLKLECSGQLDNVQFSFQDTGTSPLSNQYVSVYDGIGGTKIDGLEIEMSYGGIPFKVNKLSDAATSFIKTSTGGQGTMKTNPSDLSFNSQTTVQFGVRFVQRSAITKSGSSYTGPVTGRVNMFVTYN